MSFIRNNKNMKYVSIRRQVRKSWTHNDTDQPKAVPRAFGNNKLQHGNPFSLLLNVSIALHIPGSNKLNPKKSHFNTSSSRLNVGQSLDLKNKQTFLPFNRVNKLKSSFNYDRNCSESPGNEHYKETDLKESVDVF